MSVNHIPGTLAGAQRGRRDDPEGGAGAFGGGFTPLTPGMAMVQNAVSFTNSAVLDPTANLSGTIRSSGMNVGANALAEQAGAMMIEDVRSFLQSMEMIMVPAAARALSETLSDEPGGQMTITALGTLMNDLTKFAGAVIGEAATTKSALT
jgi:hypothetical protein